jgi:hypothetical protein
MSLNFSTGAYEAEHEAQRYIELHGRLSTVLPTEPLAELSKAVTAHRTAENAAQAVVLPDLDALRGQYRTRLADVCETGPGYTAKDLTAAGHEITAIRATNDAARALVNAVKWETIHRVRVVWPVARPGILTAMADTLSSHSDRLRELAALIPADFTDAHAFHARDEMQQAWRELATLADLVALACDVERTDPSLKAYGVRPLPLVLKIVEDPIAHGGTSRDLGLSSVGYRSLPDDRPRLLRELGARGARLTYRPHADADAWTDRHFYDLPTSDQRRELVRQLDNRWRNAA